MTDTTWASVQRSTEAEVLNLWMDTPMAPRVSVGDADGNTIGERQEAQNSDTESLHQTTPPARTATNTIYEELEPVPVIRPFLHWDIFDDFGNPDESAPEVKVNRFLSAIYRSLHASCALQSAPSAPQAAQTPQASHGAKPSISVIGRTAKDADDLTYRFQEQAHQKDPIIEQKFRKETVKLFSYYVPATAHNENLAPLRLFWGLLYELIVSLLLL